MGDTYYGALLDLWEKVENQSNILDALNKAMLNPDEVADDEEVSKDNVNLPSYMKNSSVTPPSP